MTTPTTPPPFLPDAAAVRLLRGDLDLLEEGLKRGLRVDALWPTWNVPLLHGTCLFCPPKAPAMVKAILGAGASMTLTHQGLTPMMFAISGFNREDGDALGVRMEMIKALLEADPNPNLTLWAMISVRVGYKPALELFLDNGCDANATLDGGHSLLHEAYVQRHPEMGNMLVKRGANPQAINEEGKTPRDSIVSEEPGPTENEEIQALDLTICTISEESMPEGRHLRL